MVPLLSSVLSQPAGKTGWNCVQWPVHAGDGKSEQVVKHPVFWQADDHPILSDLLALGAERRAGKTILLALLAVIATGIPTLQGGREIALFVMGPKRNHQIVQHKIDLVQTAADKLGYKRIHPLTLTVVSDTSTRGIDVADNTLILIDDYWAHTLAVKRSIFPLVGVRSGVCVLAMGTPPDKNV